MSVNLDTNLAFAFGPFRLIPSQQLLVRKDRPVKLGGRALDILHLLVTRAGQEVSKNTLIEFAWPNVFVDDSNLKVHISSLRRALEDTFPQATYIATVPGRGYKFVRHVQTEHIETNYFKSLEEQVVSSLPAPATLIGRQRDIEGVGRALDFARFVTLVGPGGVGKTSLAIAVAHARHEKFPDGVHFVDFSATDDSALVPHLLAIALGVRYSPADLIPATVEHLRNNRLLIVLDNCEHVGHAVATLAAQLVQANIASCLLATSREPLGIAGENVQRVETLPYPLHGQKTNASEAQTYPAIKLFCLRAFETADYQLTDEDTLTISRLCEALDGLPLAIEIVASKLSHFSADELLNSVGRHISQFRNISEGAHSRHLTLWATLDWSYQLLSPQEAALLRLLSVFASFFEWTDVIGMAGLAHLDPYQTTVALGGLVSKSLLLVEVEGEQLLYRLLESTRYFAAEKLLKEPCANDAGRRHAQIVLAVFEKSTVEWPSVDNRIWRRRYEARSGDLRKALDWCFKEGGDTSLGVDLVTSAPQLWNAQSAIFEQLFQVERALNHCSGIRDEPRRKAHLSASRAMSLTFAGHPNAEVDYAWSSAIKFAELGGDFDQLLWIMSGRSFFLLMAGRNESTICLMDEFSKIATRTGDRGWIFDAKRLGALAEAHLGDLAAVHAKLEILAKELERGVPPTMVGRYEDRYSDIHMKLAFLTWLMGRPERGLAMAEDVVLFIGQGGRTMVQSLALMLVAMPLALWSGQIETLERYSSTLQFNLVRDNIAAWEPVQRFYASASRYLRGEHNAVHDMRVAVDEIVRGESLIHAPMYLGVLADCLLDSGKSAEAKEAIEEALKLQEETKENWYLPELQRVKAKIMLLLGEQEDASALLAIARASARKTGARSFDLRIVNDMAQMAITKGNTHEVLELLTPVYECFEERTATEDLKQSARLLDAAQAKRALLALGKKPVSTRPRPRSAVGTQSD
jgi:predicted ATPase/DNA-binding winged helix-turn-helix (wHTH) protein